MRLTPQYGDPLAQYFTETDPNEDPLQKILLQQLGPQARELFPDIFKQEMKYPDLNPEEEKEFWKTLGHTGMSLVGHAGEFLDKYTGSRALRALIGGISGQVPWSRAGRELFSTLPGSDVFGWTDPETTVWSEDITGLKGEGYSGFRKGLDWGDVINFGADVVLDPTNALTFGAKGAATHGMRALQKAGHADSFFDAVRTGKYVKQGQRAQMGMREAKLTHSLDDVWDWTRQLDETTGQQIRADITVAMEAEDLLRPARGAELPGAERAALHASGSPALVPKAGVKEAPLSGLVGVGVPFRRPTTTVGYGPMSQSMARGMDMAGEWLVNAPVIKQMLPLYDHTMRGALSIMGRRVARRTTREAGDLAAEWGASAVSLRDEIWKTGIGGAPTHPITKTLPQSPLWGGEPVKVAIGRGIPDAPKGVTFGDMLDPTSIGPERAMQHHMEVRSYLEGVTDFPEWARGFGLEDRMDRFKSMLKDAADYVRMYGGKMPDLDDVIGYVPRQRKLFGLWDKGRAGARAFDVKSQHAIGRDPLLKFHPGGTEVLQRMSLDPKISGILHKLPRTAKGTLRRIPEEVMAELRKHVAQEYWDELFGGSFSKHYNPPKSLGYEGKFPAEMALSELTPAQTNHLLDPIIHWAASLDPKHAAHGIPAYRLNPFDDMLEYFEHAIETGEASRAVHELFAEASGYHHSLPAGDAIPVKDALREVGLEGDEAIEAFRRTAHGNQLSKQRIEGEINRLGLSPDDAGNLTAWDTLLVPREIVEDAKRYLRPFSSPAELNPFIRAFDIFTNAFKTGVTTLFPAFHTRNFVSAMFNNYVSGMSDPRFGGPKSILQPLLDAGKLMDGGVIKGAGDISFVNDAGMLVRYTDEEATRRLMAEVYANDVFRRGGRSQDPSEIIGGGGPGGAVGLEGKQPLMRDVLPLGILNRPARVRKPLMNEAGEWIPENVGALESPGGALGRLGVRLGGVPLSSPGFVGTTAAMAIPEAYLPVRQTAERLSKSVPMVDGAKPTLWQKYEEYMPWNLRGVAGDETKFFLARWGEDVASAVEGYNRIAPFIAFRRQGMSAAEAARKVKAAQVDYKAMTQFERKVMKRIFPFYSFTRRMTPFVIEQLIQRPSGAMAQALRRGSQLRGSGQEANLLPPWVTKGTAIPVGETAEGTAKYLMSLGLAHEDPLSLLHIGGSPYQTLSGTLRQVGSRINPLPKTIIEGMTGKTLYGGGDLRFLKPAWAYAQKKSESGILSSFLGHQPAPGAQPSPIKTLTANLNPLTPGLANYLASAATGQLVPYGSPRFLTSARILRDAERKTAWQRVMGLTTGFKIGDVNIARARNLALNERMKDFLYETPGVMKMESLYLPKGVPLETLSPQQQIMMRAYRQQAREQQKIARLLRGQTQDRMLYPRMPTARRGGTVTPESLLRPR